MANERTYLAWVRTGMGMMGFGVVIAKLANVAGTSAESAHLAIYLGMLFAIIGLSVVCISGNHYFKRQDQINNQTYKPRKRWVMLLTVLFLIVGTAAVLFLFHESKQPLP